MSYNPTPKWVLNQNASFQEEISVADTKKVTHGGDNATYKIVQTVNASDEKAHVVIGNDNTGSEDYVKLDKDTVMIKQFTDETKLVSKELQLKANNSLSVQTVNGHDNVVLNAGDASLSIINASNNSSTVGPHQGKAELKFTSGNSGHDGYIPILDSNHMIPTEYLSNALAFDGKLKYRNTIFLQWNGSAWALDTSSMDSIADWYSGAREELEPGKASTDTPDKYWNYAFATGTFYLVKFDSSTNSPTLPANTTLSNLFTLLANGGYLRTHADASDKWYNPDNTANDNFADFSQGNNYEVSNSDMIVIRNSAASGATDFTSKVHVTVVDNSDEFQTRLISATEVKFPDPFNSKTTLTITDTNITGSTSDSISFTAEKEAVDGISLTAKHSTKDTGGITVVAGTHGVDLDSMGKLSLVSSQVQPSAVEVKATGGTTATLEITSNGDGASAIDINSSGGVDVDAEGVVDIVTTSTTDATFDGNTLSTGAPGAFHVQSAGGIGLDAASRVSILASANGGNAIKLVAAGTAGGVVVSSGTNGVDVDSSGKVSLNSSANETYAVELKASGSHANTTLVIDSAGTGASAVDIDSSGGFDVLAKYAGANAIKLHSDNPNGGMLLQVDSTHASTGSLKLYSSEQTNDDAIHLHANKGGATIETAKSIVLTSNESASDAILLNATTGTGGIDINAAQSGVNVHAELGQIVLESNQTSSQAVKFNASGQHADTTLFINSAGTGASAIDIDSAGGVDIDATSSINVQAGAQLSLVSSQEADNAVVIDASGEGGGIDMDADSGGINITTTGKGQFVAPTLDLGNSTANDAGSVNLLNDTCLSFAGRRVLGCLRPTPHDILGGVILTMTPERGQGKNASFFVSLRFTAADGKKDATGTYAEPRQASGSINLCYHHKSAGTSETEQTASVDVQNYYFNGPVVAHVGYQNDQPNNAPEVGNLIIWLGWSGTEGSDFDRGGQWSISYDVMHDQEVSTSITASDDLKYVRLKLYSSNGFGVEAGSNYFTSDISNNDYIAAAATSSFTILE